jgi:hypothetical protein
VDLETVLIVLTSIHAGHKRLLRIAGKTGYNQIDLNEKEQESGGGKGCKGVDH